MKTFLTALGAALVSALAAGLALLTLAPAAQAYPEPNFDISVNHQVVVGGNDFIAKARANVECSDWTLSFLKQRASGVGKTLDHTFTTPVVKKKTVYPVQATCSYAAVGSAQVAAGAARQTWRGEIPITVLPEATAQGGPHANTGGGLPGTGGPSFWILLAALVLLLGGATALLRSRRREAAAGTADPTIPTTPTP